MNYFDQDLLDIKSNMCTENSIENTEVIKLLKSLYNRLELLELSINNMQNKLQNKRNQ